MLEPRAPQIVASKAGKLSGAGISEAWVYSTSTRSDTCVTDCHWGSKVLLTNKRQANVAGTWMDFEIVDMSGQVTSIIDWKRILGLVSSLASHQTRFETSP